MAQQAHRGFLLTTALDGTVFVTKDGHRICTAKSVEEAKAEIDKLLD